jgi:hypothetical protein
MFVSARQLTSAFWSWPLLKRIDMPDMVPRAPICLKEQNFEGLRPQPTTIVPEIALAESLL